MSAQDAGNERGTGLSGPFETEVAPIVTGGPRRGSARPGLGGATLVVALCVAVAGLAFAAGRLTAPTVSRAAAFGGFGGRGGGGQPGASGAPFGFGGGGLRSLVLRGTVTEVADGRLTIQLASGATVAVDLGAATTVHRQSPASSGDLAAGLSVLVELSNGGGSSGQGGGPGGAAASPGPSGERQLGTAADITILSP